MKMHAQHSERQRALKPTGGLVAGEMGQTTMQERVLAAFLRLPFEVRVAALQGVY